MTATVAGIHLGIDTHANRPAANTVPDGSLYSCSTHSLVYKSNFAGNSWATWATLSGGTILAHSTLGYTTAGSSFDSSRGLFVKKITLAADGFIMAIRAHVKGDSAQMKVVPTVYADSAGSPTNLINAPYPGLTVTPSQVSAMILNSTARWMTLPVGSWHSAGDYWIGVFLTGTAPAIAYDGSGSDKIKGIGTINNPDDSSINAFSASSNKYSIYADILS